MLKKRGLQEDNLRLLSCCFCLLSPRYLHLATDAAVATSSPRGNPRPLLWGVGREGVKNRGGEKA